MAERNVRIKICGLTQIADVQACVSAGVDWIGLNFYPASVRYIDPSIAAELVAALPDQVDAVGLFVDRSPDEVAAVAERVGLKIVQLHGQEPPEDLLALSHLKVVRGFRLADVPAVQAMNDYLRRCSDLGRTPDAVLVDGYVAGQAGGTGHAFSSELDTLLPAHPQLILAGGLTPENVGTRVAQVRPWMVDVATGVESSPGRKDPAKIQAFVRAATNA